MANGDPLYHLSQAVEGLRTDIRDTRREMGEFRTELADTRETVARMQGVKEGADQQTASSRSGRTLAVEIVAAAAVILGAVGAFHPF